MKALTRFFLMCITVTLLTSCPQTGGDDFLPAEEAMIEIRAAHHEISNNLNAFMETPSMEAIKHLLDFLGDDSRLRSMLLEHYKSTPLQWVFCHHKPIDERTFQPEGNSLIANYRGLFRYNFNSGAFDLIDSNINYLRFIFPSDEVNISNKTFNASFTIENISYISVEQPLKAEPAQQHLLTNSTISLEIDYQTALAFNLVSTYNENGLPLATDMSASMNGYQFRLSLAGSGQNYSSVMSLRSAGENLLSHNLSIRYNTALDDLSRLSGHLQLTPLRFEGGSNMAGALNCPEDDLTCKNNSLETTLKHIDYNKTVGHLAYRMHQEPDQDKEYPQLFIVYKDGSSERLASILHFKPEE